MADLHEAILRVARRKLMHGFREERTPMPTFLPDAFGRKYSKSGRITRELVIEAETESTIFTHHTAEQLEKMREYVLHQRKKGVVVDAILLVPKNKTMLSHAKMVLHSQFPNDQEIRILLC